MPKPHSQSQNKTIVLTLSYEMQIRKLKKGKKVHDSFEKTFQCSESTRNKPDNSEFHTKRTRMR